MNSALKWSAVLAVLALLAACNTFEGLGKDVQKAGEKLQGMTKK